MPVCDRTKSIAALSRRAETADHDGYQGDQPHERPQSKSWRSNE
jgi:hypothetical protein